MREIATNTLGVLAVLAITAGAACWSEVIILIAR